MSAAIIDDVLGIIVLTLISGLKDPDSSLLMVGWETLLFFIFAIVVGYLMYQAFEWMDARHPHTRRLPILALAFCFAMAYIAEEYFGIADITGAYVAGVVLSNLNDASYIERKMDINSYTIFSPVFFASIGLSTDVGEMDTRLLLFTIAFVVIALLAKVIGCGGRPSVRLQRQRFPQDRRGNDEPRRGGFDCGTKRPAPWSAQLHVLYQCHHFDFGLGHRHPDYPENFV